MSDDRVPADCLSDTLLEPVRRHPAKLILDLGCINGVAAIMAGSVLDEGDQAAGIASEMRRHFINQIADQLHDSDVGPFIVAPDIIGFPNPSPVEDKPEGFGVVAHVEPVAHVHSVAIDRHRLFAPGRFG